jgi:hypothetical protein
VDQPQPSQQALAERIVGQFRDEDLPFVADDDVFDFAEAVDEETDLPPDFQRQFGQGAGQVRRDKFDRGNPPPVEAFKGLELAGLEAGEIAVQVFDAATPVVRASQADDVVAAVDEVDLAADGAGKVAAQVDG